MSQSTFKVNVNLLDWQSRFQLENCRTSKPSWPWSTPATRWSPWTSWPEEVIELQMPVAAVAIISSRTYVVQGGPALVQINRLESSACSYLITLPKRNTNSSPGGLDLSRRGLDRDSRSRQRKKVSLNGREDLDSFKKLVLTIEISRFCLDTSEKSKKSRSRPRNLSRHDIFSKSRQFVSILIES
jgi:hypothetical protein